MITLPIHVDERIKVFSSLTFPISDELINIFANNKYIYAITDYPTLSLEYLTHDDKGIAFLDRKIYSVFQFLGTPANISRSINSNRPFILYRVDNSPLMINPQSFAPITKCIIRGLSTPNYENETMYKQYKENFILYRENRINKILE
jgi:hypothetical protein